MPGREAGQGRSGRGPATIEQVAALAGVSRATVSRAVNGGVRVSPRAQAAVDGAVRELGYTPNRAARNLVTRRTESIAVVVPESGSTVLADPFVAAALHGVACALAPADLQLVLLVRQPGEGVDRMARYLGGGHTDGVVVISHHRGDGVTEVLDRTDVPRVFVGRPWEVGTTTPFVDVDHVEGARLAVTRLVARGCRRIGAVTGPQDTGAGVDRLTGWRRAMTEAGLPADAVVAADSSRVGGREATAALLARHADLDGLFVASDLMAAGALSMLAGHGRSAPDDVAVIGFDDFSVAREQDTPLTTVANPVAAMAEAAVGLLLEQLAGPAAGERSGRSVVFPAELVVRASG